MNAENLSIFIQIITMTSRNISLPPFTDFLQNQQTPNEYSGFQRIPLSKPLQHDFGISSHQPQKREKATQDTKLQAIEFVDIFADQKKPQKNSENQPIVGTQSVDLLQLFMQETSLGFEEQNLPSWLIFKQSSVDNMNKDHQTQNNELSEAQGISNMISSKHEDTLFHQNNSDSHKGPEKLSQHNQFSIMVRQTSDFLEHKIQVSFRDYSVQICDNQKQREAEERIMSLQERVDGQYKTIDSLQMKIAQKQKQIVQKQEQLNEKTEQVNLLEEKYQEKVKLLENIKGFMEENEKQICALTVQIERSEAEREQGLKYIKSLYSQVQNLKERSVIDSNKIEQLIKQITKENHLNQKLTQQCLELEKNNEINISQVTNLKLQNEEAKRNIKMLERKCEDLENVAEKSKEMVKVLGEQIQKIHRETNEALSNSHSEKVSMKQRIDELEIKLAAKLQVITNHEKDTNQSDHNYSEENEKNKESKSESNAEESNQEQCGSLYNTRINQEQKQQFLEHIQKLEQKLGEQEKMAYQGFQEKEDQFRQKVLELENLIEKLVHESEEYKWQIQTEIQERTTYQKSYENLSKSYAQLQQSFNDKIRSHNEIINYLTESGQNEKNELIQLNQKINQQLIQAVQKIQEQTQSIEAKTKMVNKIKHQIKAIRQQFIDLNESAKKMGNFIQGIFALESNKFATSFTQGILHYISQFQSEYKSSKSNEANKLISLYETLNIIQEDLISTQIEKKLLKEAKDQLLTQFIKQKQIVMYYEREVEDQKVQIMKLQQEKLDESNWAKDLEIRFGNLLGECKKLESESIQQRNMREQLEKRVREIEEQSKDDKLTIQEISEQMQMLMNENKNVNQKLKHEIFQKLQACQKVEDLQIWRQQILKEKESLKEMERVLKIQLSQKKQQLLRKETQIKELQINYEKQMEERFNIQQKYTEMSLSHSNSNDAIQNIGEELTKERQKCNKLKNRIQAVQSKFHVTQVQLICAKQKLIQSETELGKMRSMMEASESRKNINNQNRQNELEEITNHYEELIKQLRQEIEQHEDTITELMEQLSHTKSELSKAQEKRDQEKQVFEEMKMVQEQTRMKLEKQIEKNYEIVTELQKEKENSSNLSDEYGKLEDLYNLTHKQLMDQEHELSSLNQDKSSTYEEIESLRKFIEKQNTEREDLHKNILALQDIINQKEEDIHLIRLNHEIEKQKKTEFQISQSSIYVESKLVKQNGSPKNKQVPNGSVGLFTNQEYKIIQEINNELTDLINVNRLLQIRVSLLEQANKQYSSIIKNNQQGSMARGILNNEKFEEVAQFFTELFKILQVLFKKFQSHYSKQKCDFNSLFCALMGQTQYVLSQGHYGKFFQNVILQLLTHFVDNIIEFERGQPFEIQFPKY